VKALTLGRGPGRLLAAAACALTLSVWACSEPPEPEGRLWSFPHYELSLRLPENWEVSDAYAIYARRVGLPESEARALTLPEVVRRTRFLLVARPPAGENPSGACTVSIQTEDLSSYPKITDVEAYAELAERAAKRHLTGYERLGPDLPVSLGHTSMVRREVRALQPLAGSPVPVRNVTLFWKHGRMGIAIGVYELDQEFEQRRAQLESILGSVRVGPPEPRSWWSRWLGRPHGTEP
jgi:hypothetical protein